MSFAESLKYDANGLIPVVVQDAANDQVLMVAYMNRAAVERTLETRKATYWSRSRQEFWVKGASSGNFQYVSEMLVDCDADCLLLKVEQIGAACHTGCRSCFFRAVTEEGDLSTIAEPIMDAY
jgi:phosphoribosyl-AMP cyclohydrolase